MTVRRPTVSGLIALAFVLLFSVGHQNLSAGESPVGKVIADVVTVNNRVRTKELILSQMQTRPGKTYDDGTMQEDVRKLIASKWFAPGGVKIETAISTEGRVTVYVQVVELNNVVLEVQFVGAQHMSADEMLRLSGIRKGSPLNPAFNEAAAQIIQNKYREDGRYHATVNVSEGMKLTDTRVIFNIVEGPVVRISKVSFRGYQAASGGRLKTQTSLSAPLSGLLRFMNDKYNPQQIEEDKKKIVNYYLKLGHLEARVQEEVIPSRDLSNVEVVYHVDEGPVYTVREVRLEGGKIFPVERLRSLIELKENGQYDRDMILGDVTRLKNFYGYRGYMAAIEDQWIAVTGKPGFVDVVYTIYEPGRRNADAPGEPVRRVSNQVPADSSATGREPDRVGRIIINGNTVTRQDVILNELRMAGLNSGQILQYPSIEVARLNLFRRGIFDSDNPPSVEIRQNEFDSIYKDIIVTVNETRTGQFLLGAGFNSNSGINGNIAINERNFDILRVPTSLDDFVNGRAFRGGGQELKLEAQPGNIFQRYSATLREPYLLNSNFGLTNSAYYFNRSFLEYNEDRIGARVTLDRRLDSIWRASLAARIEGVNVKNVPTFSPESIRRDAGQSTVFGLRGGVSRDTRDSYLFPSSGSILDLGYEQVLGDYTFPIGTAEFTKFFSSDMLQRKDGSGKHVLAVRSQLSVTSDAPVFERFFAGGFRSMRGFTFRGVGPTENGLHTGGNFALLNTVEYQIPLNAKDSLFFVTFLDHGTVERTVAIKDYRVSAGFGFRVKIPALGPVPVAFDFAFPLNKTPGDNTQVFAFYVGLFGGQ